MSDREIYKLCLKKHMNEQCSASQSYDKSILSLTTATLGFTIAYIRIAPSQIKCNCLLLHSWFFLILAIISILLSFLIYQAHHEHRVDFYYSKIDPKRKQTEEPHWSDCWMSRIPILAGIFFVTGVILFTIFVGINI